MKNIISIETKALKEIYENVKNGISKSENRPVFTGIQIEVNNNKLTMTTCDGYKLFTSSDDVEILEGRKFTAIIPAFSIPKGAELSTKIELKDDFITFDFGNVKYSYKLIKGDFIEWKHFFQRENKFTINFNSNLLKEALKNTKGIIELSFVGDRDGMIIKNLEDESNKKLVLPYGKIN